MRPVMDHLQHDRAQDGSQAPNERRSRHRFGSQPMIRNLTAERSGDLASARCPAISGVILLV